MDSVRLLSSWKTAMGTEEIEQGGTDEGAD